MNTLPETNSALQEIIDCHEIKKLLAVYCHGADRCDEPRMSSVYGEGSWDDHGLFKGPGLDFPKHVMKSRIKTGMKVSHILGQSQVKVDGTQAGAETHYLATMCRKDEKGQEIMTLLGGRYVDTLKRVDGQWKINRRTCVLDWSITLDVEKDTLRNDNFVRRQTSGEDPSYAVLGLTHPGFPWAGSP